MDNELTMSDMEAFGFAPKRPGRALARASHPETSKKAADEIVQHLGYLQTIALDLVRQNPGCTQAELARIYGGIDSRKIGRRLPELLALDKVVKGHPRRCTVTGKSAATWSVAG